MNKRLISAVLVLTLLGACSPKQTESAEETVETAETAVRTSVSTKETTTATTAVVVATNQTNAVTTSIDEREELILNEDDIVNLSTFLWESDVFLGGDRKIYALRSDSSTVIVLYVMPTAKTEEDIKKNVKKANETKYYVFNKVNEYGDTGFTTALVSYIEREEDGTINMFDYVGGDIWKKTDSEESFNYLYCFTDIGWVDEDYKAAHKEYNEELQSETEPIQPKVPVYEDEYVAIAYSHISEPNWRDSRSVVFTVENKTDYVLTFQADSLAVNGIDLGDISMSDEVSPQSTGEICATSEKVTATTVSKISGQFRVVEWDKELFGALSYNAKFVNVEVS